MTETQIELEFVDTHAHLNDEQFAADAAQVIAQAASLGVTRIVNVAFSERLWPAAMALSSSHPGVAFTLGIHPNSAGEWSVETRKSLENLLGETLPCAIGEMGLDYYWNQEPREGQMTAFRDQLDIARTARLPAIIHMRGEVESDIRMVLDGQTEPMCVFHSFDGTPELATWIVERGWMIGAGGLMTRRSARELQKILREVPRSQLLLETDSPYLAPTGWSAKRNTPESIPVIAAHLAKMLELTVEETAAITTANANRIFRFENVASRDRPRAEVAGAAS